MSQNWRERYADKIVPADFAAKKIKPGNRVFIGSACGEPQALVRAMVQSGEKLADTELVQVLTLGVAHYRAGGWADSIAALEKSMSLRAGGDAFDLYFLAMARKKRQVGDWEFLPK